MNTLAELSVEQLRRAVQLREQIERLERELHSILSGQRKRPRQALMRMRPTLSAAGRARIAAAQRQRWFRVAKTKQAALSMPRRQSRLSPAGRAKIAAAARARWQRFRQQHAGGK